LVYPRVFGYDVFERIGLVKTVAGLKPADIVIVNANVVAVSSGEVVENATILVSGRRIAGFGKYSDPSRFVGNNTIVIDAENNYILPGFIDPHVHIESSLLTPTGFAMLALKHGTTTVVADPHEIGNVLGVDGVKIFIEEARDLPLKILIDIPSCIPPIDPKLGLESTANVIDYRDIEMIAGFENVTGLGEVMDYNSVLEGDENTYMKIMVAKKHGLIVNGHAPLLSGEKLDQYISAGILSDHETIEVWEALEKIRRGMYVFIREGSAWRDLTRLSKLLLDESIDCRLCCFASDDLNVKDLYEKGHMDRIINNAIELGVDPIKAIKLATINPAQYLNLVEHIGIVAPGRLADMVFTKHLNYIEPHTVIASGEVVAYKGDQRLGFKQPNPPEKVLKTINIGREITVDDLTITFSGDDDWVKVNTIMVQPGSTLTKRVVEKLRVVDNKLLITSEHNYVFVIERHHGTGNIGKGVLKGLGFKAGAIAQTIAHDTHNLIVAGNNSVDMKKAVDRVVELQGGIVIVDHGEVLAEIPLQYGGLMSLEKPEIVYKRYNKLIEVVREKYGLVFESFFMTLALISLPVIPEIRLTDKGLVDVNNSRIIPLFVSS